MQEIREKIARWTDEGTSRVLVEERIDQLPRSDEEKSELWLWAWSCRNLSDKPEVESYFGWGPTDQAKVGLEAGAGPAGGGRLDYGSTRPRRIAYRVRATRSWNPSFSMMFARWRSTVFSLITSSSAIWLVV
jgi:hypothetical protein